jgi:hypothetical protein
LRVKTGNSRCGAEKAHLLFRFVQAFPVHQIGWFHDCGSSAANIASFDPRSSGSDVATGILFYFAD